MANATAHMIVGGVAGAAVLAFKRHQENKPIDTGEFIASAAMGAFCGLLPDIIEPALNPSHRGFFHSLFFSCLVGTALYKAYSSEKTSPAQQIALVVAAAYLSHIILDAGTPAGVPLLSA